MPIPPLDYSDQQHPPIHLHVLGGFALIVCKENRTQQLSYDKAKLLLVLLAFNKKPMSRTLLAEMLWPDSDKDKGRSRVRHALHLLRQALEPLGNEVLAVSHTEIGLKPSFIFFDFFDFLKPIEHISIKEIKRKLDLYSLGFLQNLKLPSSDAFLDWYHSWQSRYELELAQYRHQLVAYYLERNDMTSALIYVKWWLSQTPKDESCYRYLIHLLVASGDKELALRAYQQCKDMLEESFNTLPSPETQALIQPSLNYIPSATVKIENTTNQVLRPIASVAISLTFTPSSSLSFIELTGAQLQHLREWQDRIYQYCVAHEACVSQSNSTTLLVHFGYPCVVERPIEQALHLVQQLRLLEPPSLQIQQAIHACTVRFQNTNTSSLDAITAQYVLPLVWLAKPGEVLLSSQAAARITEIPIEVLSSAFQPIYKLGETYCDVNATTRMFGRIRYFDRIIQQWGRYILGQAPTFIFLTGQLGLGKTQLAVAVADYVRNVEGRVLFLSSQERKVAQPYHAITDWLLGHLDGVHQLVEINRDSAQIHNFQQLLAKKHGISFATSQTLFEHLFFNPTATAKQHQAILSGFLQLISEYQGGQQPLCIIWDNLQWVDQQSLALLEQLAQSKTKKIAFILGLSRDGNDNYPWATMQLRLPPFDLATVAEYLNQRSKIKKIKPEVKRFILQSKIDNPRYINDILHLAYLKLPYKHLPRITDVIAAYPIRLGGLSLIPEEMKAQLSREIGQSTDTFEAHTSLANITIATKGPAAPAVAQAYQVAAKSSQPEDVLQSCAIFWGQWVTQHGLGCFAASLLAAQRLQRAAERAKNDVWLGWAYYAQAQYHLWKGQPELSEPLLLQAITAINVAANLNLSVSVFAGSQSSALPYSALALTQALLGRYNPALQNAKYAIHLAEQSKEPVAIMICRLHLLRVYYLTNNLTALEKDCQLILDAMPDAQAISSWYGFVQSYSIVAEHLQAPCIELLKQLEQIRDAIEKNMPAALDGYLCTLARCYLASNEPIMALATLKEASTISEQHESLLLQPEIHCLQGDAFLILGHSEQAHIEWYKAKKIAKEQQILVYLSWLNDRLAPEGSVS